MENYIKKNDEILKEWKENRMEDSNDFITDGIVDTETWFKPMNEKILFLFPLTLQLCVPFARY